MLVDTHCHLNFEAFEKDYLGVVERAKKVRVKKIVVIGVDEKSNKRAIEMAGELEGGCATVGFHPHHCKGFKGSVEELRGELRGLARNERVKAIGECGLDYYVYGKSKYGKVKIDEKMKRLQKQVLGMQVQLAKELDLPLVIHNRQAGEEVLDVIEHFSKSDNRLPRGVFHCIAGSKRYLERVLERGFYVGVDGNVTYNQEVQGLVEKIPLERMVLETDSPLLTPVPYRGLRNEPANVKIVAEFIAKVKNISINEIEASTTKNAEALFNI